MNALRLSLLTLVRTSALAIGFPSPSVIVPVGSILFRSEGLRVGVVHDGKVQLMPVVLGKDYGTEVEVISGLSPDDQVIMNPADSLTSGTAVRVVPRNESTPNK